VLSAPRIVEEPAPAPRPGPCRRPCQHRCRVPTGSATTRPAVRSPAGTERPLPRRRWVRCSIARGAARPAGRQASRPHGHRGTARPGTATAGPGHWPVRPRAAAPPGAPAEAAGRASR
jgi:hypothetical protein